MRCITVTRDARAERLQRERETTSLLYYRMMENMEYGQQERLKDIVEKEAEEEEKPQEEDLDLTQHEHERVLKGAYRSFVIPGMSKIDIDSYFDQTKAHIRTLIEMGKMGFAKKIMTLWVIWEKSITPLIELDPEDAKNAQDLADGITGDNYIWVEMPFNSIMTQCFSG